jgi:ABC-type transport system substrate-binding protein
MNDTSGLILNEKTPFLLSVNSCAFIGGSFSRPFLMSFSEFWIRVPQWLCCALAFGLLPLALNLTAVQAAEPEKVIRCAFTAADDGFDAAKTYNSYSLSVTESIFETLLTYDYLARPAKLVPLTVESMPEITDGGRTYTFHLKKGITFAPDPVFKGARRELIAQDYAYAFKRLLDPVLRSPSTYMIEGKITGLDALAAKAKKSGRFDYDAPVAGLETPDRYTLRIHLTRTNYDFLYIAAYSALAGVAREVIEAYGQDTGRHPVGTGPYMLKEYVPRSKIVLEENPNYRGFVWDFTADGGAWDEQLVRDMRGKQMPQVGRVVINIIEEDQSVWLAFLGGQLDYAILPQTAAPMVMDRAQLKPEFARQGIGLFRAPEVETTYTLFSMRDPVLGGYTLDRIALRRAIVMAHNVQEEITLIRRGQAMKSEMVVPEGVVGHDSNYRNSIPYDPDLANRLLDSFGYKRGVRGYRTFPDGTPLTVELRQEPDSLSRQFGELWKRNLDAIGLHLNITVSEFADNSKAAMACKLPMWSSAWLADYPEAENFLQLLYGPNIGQGNSGCYKSAEFDEMYRELVTTPPGPARNQIVIKMSRQVEADTAWAMGVTRIRNWLVRPWMKGLKPHPIMNLRWQYLDVEKH